jgi:DNA replication protein DnaC
MCWRRATRARARRISAWRWAWRLVSEDSVDELGFVPLSKTGAEMLFEVMSQRYERASTLVTSNLPFAEWTEVLGSKRLTGALLDRLTHHVHIPEMNGEGYRLTGSRKKKEP